MISDHATHRLPYTRGSTVFLRLGALLGLFLSSLLVSITSRAFFAAPEILAKVPTITTQMGQRNSCFAVALPLLARMDLIASLAWTLLAGLLRFHKVPQQHVKPSLRPHMEVPKDRGSRRRRQCTSSLQHMHCCYRKHKQRGSDMC
jgi:hypothetical protein